MKLKTFLLFILKLIRIILYYIASLLPRNKHKWIFGATGWYGNSKYLFREVVEKHPEINAIWISHNKLIAKKLKKEGYKSYYWLSMKGIYHSATAKVYISNITIREINIVLAGGVFYFDLWHGIPMKACLWKENIHKYDGYTITEQNKNSFISKVMGFGELYRKPDLVLSTSDFETKNVFAPMFNVPTNKCIETNYPQNKILRLQKNELIDYIKKFEKSNVLDLIEQMQKYSKVFIYMPTFRDNNESILENSRFDFDALNDILERNNQLFIFKPHPGTNIDPQAIGTHPNIITISKDIDVYTILQFTHCLITDYSSIYYDYLQTDGDIIIFDFDKESYIKNNREFIFDFEEMMPAVRAHSFEELLSLIKENKDCSVPDKDNIMNKIWAECNNGIDLVEEVKHRIGIK